MQATVSKTTNSTAMIKAYHLKPTLSYFEIACTILIVKMVTRAEPTPAQVLARVVSPSRSLPPFVNAGIIDQYGMSIIV